MEYFLQQLINGLTLGSVYGLIAIGYTMVYGIIGMINFAHGDIFMVGAFVALIAFILFALTSIALPIVLILVLLIAMVFTACYGWTVEKLAYKPLRKSFRLAPLISALGMSIVLQNYVQAAQGARIKTLQPVIQGGFNFFKESDFVVTLSYLQIFIVLVTIVLMSIFTLLITNTALGRAQRACEQDRTMTALMGINVDRTISMTFIIGSSLASVAGVMFVMYYGVIDFYIGFLAGIKAFTAAVLGGIGSIPGAMLGGLLIGLIETFFPSSIFKSNISISIFKVFFPRGPSIFNKLPLRATFTFSGIEIFILPIFDIKIPCRLFHRLFFASLHLCRSLLLLV